MRNLDTVAMASTVAEMFEEADETLFHHRVLANNNYALQSYLPDRSRSQCNLRAGAHSKELDYKDYATESQILFYTHAIQKMLLSIKRCRTQSF